MKSIWPRGQPTFIVYYCAELLYSFSSICVIIVCACVSHVSTNARSKERKTMVNEHISVFTRGEKLLLLTLLKDETFQRLIDERFESKLNPIGNTQYFESPKVKSSIIPSQIYF